MTGIIKYNINQFSIYLIKFGAYFMIQSLEILKALADETRIKILTLLLTNDFCVGALANKLSLSEAAISQHLQLLRKSGLVKGEKRGYFTHYIVDRAVLKDTAGIIIKASETKPQCEGNCRKDKQGEKKQCCRKVKENNELN